MELCEGVDGKSMGAGGGGLASAGQHVSGGLSLWGWRTLQADTVLASLVHRQHCQSINGGIS